MENNEKNRYHVNVTSLETDHAKAGEIEFDTIVKCIDMNNSIYAIPLWDMLRKRGILFKGIVGCVLEVDEEKQTAIIGHEGSPCGNLKTIHQFEVTWSKI
ncbi:hypothetical protein SHAb15599_00157 [Acinetobacter phage SH-Ab 15599]|nr:hypothetical protein SHAb15599_00157 [Acinetobacter phage SH-Ab 15599]